MLNYKYFLVGQVVPSSGGHTKGLKLYDLKTDLEARISEGRDLNVFNAIVDVKVMVDAALTSNQVMEVTPMLVRAENGANFANISGNYAHMQALLDPNVDQEFIFKEFPRIQLKPTFQTTAGNILFTGKRSFNISKDVKKFLLHDRNPALANRPEFWFIVACRGNTDTFYIHGTLNLSYTTVQKNRLY